MSQSIYRSLYIGTYTEGKSEGIYHYSLDTSTGLLITGTDPVPITNPSFLAVDSQHRYLYSVSEDGNPSSGSTGSVSSFSIDSDGRLEHLNTQSSGGDHPCHLSLDATDRQVLVANYNGGSVSILPIGSDGALGEATHIVQHGGSGPNPERQQGPHPHSINVDPTNRFAFVPDLGIDKILTYKLDLVFGKLLPTQSPDSCLSPGAGPRHFDFHPNGSYAYAINELDSTITAYSYEQTTGTLHSIQTISTLPTDFTGTNHPADIHVAPSGKFVYGSNRGHDTIVIFSIDQESGKLSPVDYEPTRGKFPRNFAIDPTGKFMLVANQNSDNIITFKIDATTGSLTQIGDATNVPSPVCILPV